MSAMSEVDLIRQELDAHNALHRAKRAAVGITAPTPALSRIEFLAHTCAHASLSARMTLRVLRRVYPGERFTCLNENVYVHSPNGMCFHIALCDEF